MNNPPYINVYKVSEYYHTKEVSKILAELYGCPQLDAVLSERIWLYFADSRDKVEGVRRIVNDAVWHDIVFLDA